MAPIALSSLNLAAKHIIRSAPSVSAKSYLSYTISRKSYTEQAYYANGSLYNQPPQASQVFTNVGSVESSEMHFVKASQPSNTSVSDVDEKVFVPSVSSDSNDVSGNGHSKI